MKYMNVNEAHKAKNPNHPATFEILALEPKIKGFVLNYLASFLKRKDNYRKIRKT